MLPRNPTASNKRSRRTAGLSDIEPILLLPHRIPNEANKIMWYNNKLKNKLVVECMVDNLLESQVGVLAHFWAIEWDSIVTMIGEILL